MEVEITLNLESEWIESETDLSNCAVCKEIITSKMFSLKSTLYAPHPIEVRIEPAIKTCASCMDLINKQA